MRIALQHSLPCSSVLQGFLSCTIPLPHNKQRKSLKLVNHHAQLPTIVRKPPTANVITKPPKETCMSPNIPTKLLLELSHLPFSLWRAVAFFNPGKYFVFVLNGIYYFLRVSRGKCCRQPKKHRARLSVFTLPTS